jgi:ABC-type spermidine/putrescine transport system permease subunit I
VSHSLSAATYVVFYFEIEIEMHGTKNNKKWQRQTKRYKDTLPKPIYVTYFGVTRALAFVAFLFNVLYFFVNSYFFTKKNKLVVVALLVLIKLAYFVNLMTFSQYLRAHCKTAAKVCNLKCLLLIILHFLFFSV